MTKIVVILNTNNLKWKNKDSNFRKRTYAPVQQQEQPKGSRGTDNDNRNGHSKTWLSAESPRSLTSFQPQSCWRSVRYYHLRIARIARGARRQGAPLGTTSPAAPSGVRLQVAVVVVATRIVARAVATAPRRVVIVGTATEFTI